MWSKNEKYAMQYLPAHYMQNVFLKRHYLQQREQLMLKCELTEPEENAIAKYLR